MLVLPVIDLLNGVVVRGVAGRRESYRPVVSQICASAEPLAVAEAFRSHFGLERLYLADLDAILYQRPNFDIYRRLKRAAFATLVDAGVQDLATAQGVLDAGADSVIAGLESMASPQLLGELVRNCGTRRIIFSLDLKAGLPIVRGKSWQGMTPLRIGEIALEQGIKRLIVLDLAQVGVSEGVSTLGLCTAIRALAPRVELISGGGVRDAGDLNSLVQSGVDGVLIASALHDGRLRRSDLEEMSAIDPIRAIPQQ